MKVDYYPLDLGGGGGGGGENMIPTTINCYVAAFSHHPGPVPRSIQRKWRHPVCLIPSGCVHSGFSPG